MDLIYEDPTTKASIWQGGYREIPWDLKEAAIDVVLYSASECPPLNHHVGAEKFSCPNDDSMAPPGHPIYLALYQNALKGVTKLVETIKNGKNALVTCSQGQNRSGLIIGLGLRQLTTWSPEEIIKTIQSKRPGALNNPYFVSMIKSPPKT